MQCSICHNDPVIYQPYSGQHLCREHFIASVDAKVKRDIRRHHWLQSNDHIGVLQDGDLPGKTLLFFLTNLIRNRKDIRVSAITVGAGIPPDAGLTKCAIATTLEDAATSVLASVLRGQPGQQILSEHAGDCPALPVIVPFSHIPAEEIVLYGRLHGISGDVPAVPQESDPFLSDVRSLLADYSGRHPATPHAVVNLGESLAAFGETEQLKKFMHQPKRDH
jgi:hypothetical protein